MKKLIVLSAFLLVAVLNSCSVLPKNSGLNEQMMKDLAGVWLKTQGISWLGSSSSTNIYGPTSNYTTCEAFTASGGYVQTNYSTNGIVSSVITGTFIVDNDNNRIVTLNIPCITNFNVIYSGNLSGTLSMKIASLTAGASYTYQGKYSINESFIGTIYVYGDSALTNLITSFPTNMSINAAYGDDRDIQVYSYQ